MHDGGQFLRLVCFRFSHQPLVFKAEGILRQQLKRLENCAQRGDSSLAMKSILLTTIAAVLVVGCGESRSPEPPTAEASDIPLWEAAYDGNIEAVKQHIADGSDVNAENHAGWTPLYAATAGGHKEIVDLLIANGANVNAKYAFRTPLHEAALGGHKEIGELLIANGANVNVNATIAAGETPLDYAISENHTETADLLRKHGGKRGSR